MTDKKRSDYVASLRAMKTGELLEELSAIEKASLELRLQAGGAVEKNVRGIRNLRRNAARVKTLLREREIDSYMSGEAAAIRAGEALPAPLPAGNAPGAELEAGDSPGGEG
ncbi:MAG: 50S ribosomal protein L29 [Deltaproteobacteria bacterium]|nr:50S ribosomal protein L29 [Deltaproteobacteria bacterium]